MFDETYDYVAPFVENANYIWTVDGGTIIGSNTGDQVTIRWDDVPEGIASVNISLPSGCEKTLSLKAYISDVLLREFPLQKYEECVPFKVKPKKPYDYNVIGISTQSRDEQSVSFDGKKVNHPGQYTIIMVAENDYGCIDTFTHLVTGYPSPVADFEFGFDPYTDTVFDNQEFSLINTSLVGEFFRWFIDEDTLYQNSTGEFTHAIDSFDVYKITLEAENEYGCTDLASKKLRVHPEEWLYVPNAFTPNGDGLNDVFEVVYNNIAIFEVLVVDRWGSILFRSQDPGFTWDGRTEDGELLPEGVYVYRIQAWGFSGRSHHKQGSLTLIR
jgi:gliding motility-associated-like protein